MTRVNVLGAVLGRLVAAHAACAAGLQRGGNDSGGRQGARAMLIAACEGKSARDKVELSRRGRTVKATCEERRAS